MFVQRYNIRARAVPRRRVAGYRLRYQTAYYCARAVLAGYPFLCCGRVRAGANGIASDVYPPCAAS